LGLKANKSIGVNGTNCINEHRQNAFKHQQQEKCPTQKPEMKPGVSERTISIPLGLHRSDFVLDESWWSCNK